MYEIVSKSHVDQLANLFMDVTFKDNKTKEVIEKRMDIETYMQLFKNNVTTPEVMVKVPKLPEEVIACRVSASSEKSFDTVVLCKAQKRAFLYHGMHLYIPFPTLIAQISVREGHKRDMHLYALATDEPTDDTPLMQYPFGNVHGDGGTCFGNILVEGVSGVAESMKVLDAFLCGETNGDLYRGQNSGKMTQGALVELLQTKEVFPVELLVSCGDKTVGTLKNFV